MRPSRRFQETNSRFLESLTIANSKIFGYRIKIISILFRFLLRAKARQSASEKAPESKANQIVPEIEHLLPDEVFDFGSHTVAVTTLDGKLGKFKEEGDDDMDAEDKEVRD